MNLREVRQAAEHQKNWYSSANDGEYIFKKHLAMCDYILATIDPEPEAAITSDWLREVWGWDNHGTMSMHYDHDEYTAFSWQQEDGLAVVAKSYLVRCYTTGFPIHTRQQFCDLARCLGIQRKDGAK